ncbi:hypothetical protein PCE1_002810 [Barthelona sp. PCE]
MCKVMLMLIGESISWSLDTFFSTITYGMQKFRYVQRKIPILRTNILFLIGAILLFNLAGLRTRFFVRNVQMCVIFDCFNHEITKHTALSLASVAYETPVFVLESKNRHLNSSAHFFPNSSNIERFIVTKNTRVGSVIPTRCQHITYMKPTYVAISSPTVGAFMDPQLWSVARVSANEVPVNRSLIDQIIGGNTSYTTDFSTNDRMWTAGRGSTALVAIGNLPTLFSNLKPNFKATVRSIDVLPSYGNRGFTDVKFLLNTHSMWKAIVGEDPSLAFWMNEPGYRYPLNIVLVKQEVYEKVPKLELFTVMTSERLGQINDIRASTDLPVSVSVYLKQGESVDAVVQIFSNISSLSYSVSIHKGGVFPINALRNEGYNLTQALSVLYIEADYIMGPIDITKFKIPPAKTLQVVPVLEPRFGFYPTSRNELVDAFTHRPRRIDFAKWQTYRVYESCLRHTHYFFTNSSYPVSWKMWCEPYYVIRREDYVLFDERFPFGVADKVEQFWNAAALDYKSYVQIDFWILVKKHSSTVEKRAFPRFSMPEPMQHRFLLDFQFYLQTISPLSVKEFPYYDTGLRQTQPFKVVEQTDDLEI